MSQYSIVFEFEAKVMEIQSCSEGSAIYTNGQMIIKHKFYDIEVPMKRTGVAMYVFNDHVPTNYADILKTATIEYLTQCSIRVNQLEIYKAEYYDQDKLIDTEGHHFVLI